MECAQFVELEGYGGGLTFEIDREKWSLGIVCNMYKARVRPSKNEQLVRF